MSNSRFFRSIIFAIAAMILPLSAGTAAAETRDNMEADAQQKLQELYDSSADAAELGRTAKAILVFPDVVKAGFLVGGSFGKGVLFRDGEALGLYKTVSGSWGFQAGAQNYAYVLFFMTDDAIDYLDRSDGWEIGAGPSIVVLDRGHADKFTSTTLRSDVYAMIFGQRGLMAGVGIEGSRISPITPQTRR